MTFREFYFGGVEGDGTIVVDVSAFDDVEDLMNEVARGLGVARAECQYPLEQWRRLSVQCTTLF